MPPPRLLLSPSRRARGAAGSAVAAPRAPAAARSAGGRSPAWDPLYLEDGEAVLAAFDAFCSTDGGPG
jgi:hypothetical protein